MTKMVTLKVESFDELRDSLYQTGLFEMSDCTIEVSCGMDSSVSEVQKMIDFIRTTINVVDTIVTPDVNIDAYQIQLQEVEPPYMRGPVRRPRKN